MRGFRFKGLLNEKGWLSSVYVEVDNSGAISALKQEPSLGMDYEEIEGFAIPGITNAHSHAFQYAMAGLAENHKSGTGQNDFWSWRHKMYQIALTIGPEELEGVANFLYSEMLRLGYTQVCEFHYLHHDKNGNQYENHAELGLQLIKAAQNAGIKITLIPILYQQGGFNSPALKEQRRFISTDLSKYFQLFEKSQEACQFYTDANIGCGIHSIRAVSPENMIEFCRTIGKDIPLHMHIAEQPKEVEDSSKYLGARSVEWVLEKLPVSDNFHFVHATHMTEHETKRLAQSGAHVVLCPSTEGNLGDGLFNLKSFQENDGLWSIGTDSHISLNPFEELRILDYGQRTKTNNRNIYKNPGHSDTGLIALDQILRNGRKAANKFQNKYFEIGQPFDALIINGQHPLIASTSLENLTSTIVYTSDPSMNLGTLVNGQWVIKNGQHANATSIHSKFFAAINSLKIR